MENPRDFLHLLPFLLFLLLLINDLAQLGHKNYTEPLGYRSYRHLEETRRYNYYVYFFISLVIYSFCLCLYAVSTCKCICRLLNRLVHVCCVHLYDRPQSNVQCMIEIPIIPQPLLLIQTLFSTQVCYYIASHSLEKYQGLCIVLVDRPGKMYTCTYT